MKLKNTKSHSSGDHDVFKILEQDHKNVKRLLHGILKKHGRSEETFDEITHELKVHMNAEEKHLYPVLEENKKLKDTVLEAYEEHSVGKELMEKIHGESTDDDHWLAKIKVLDDVIEHHIEEEEGIMFPQARKILNQEQKDEITDLILQEKNQE